MLYKKFASRTLKELGLSNRSFQDLALHCKTLISPEELICKILPKKIISEQKRILKNLIKSMLESAHYKGIYNTNELYLCFADIVAQNKSIYLVEIDIKDCRNLVKFIPSFDIYVIKSFLFSLCTDMIKKELRTDSVYAFDYTKNDDCLILIDTEIPATNLQNILINIVNLLTESTLMAYPNLDYTDQCILNFGITKLGHNKSESQLYEEFEQKINIRTKVKKSKIPGFINNFSYRHKNNFNKISIISSKPIRKILAKLYFKNEDSAGPYCNQESRFFDIKHGKGYLMNVKFNNFSGLNSLYKNKFYSYLLLVKITKYLHKMINHKSSQIYFIGQNSYLISFNEKKDFCSFVEKIEKNIDKNINNKEIQRFFKTDKLLQRNLKFKDLPSRKGYKSGISISNVNIVPLKDIQKPHNLLEFKIASYMKQFNKDQ